MSKTIDILVYRGTIYVRLTAVVFSNIDFKSLSIRYTHILRF